jgi:hypothetical protein
MKLLFAALVVFAMQTGWCQWVPHTSGYPWNYLQTTPFIVDSAEFWNYSYDDGFIPFEANGEDTYYEKVIGSDEDAPWTSKFDPRTTAPHTQVWEWSCWIELGPREWGKVRLPYLIEEGSQTWRNETSAIIAKRDRTWWYKDGLPYFRTYPIP